MTLTWRQTLSAALAASAMFVLSACAGDATPDGLQLDNDVTVTQGGDALNQDAILNEVEEVRRLFMQGSTGFAPAVISNVAFEGGTLTVTVTEEIVGLEDAQAFCQDLSTSIAAANVGIVVVDAGGARLAECSLAG
jgi:hypothetical protein